MTELMNSKKLSGISAWPVHFTHSQEDCKMSSLTAAKSSAAARRAKYRAQYAYRDQLPFLAKNPRAGTSFWNVTPTGDYERTTRLAENSRLHSGAYAAARRCAA